MAKEKIRSPGNGICYCLDNKNSGPSLEKIENDKCFDLGFGCDVKVSQ